MSRAWKSLFVCIILFVVAVPAWAQATNVTGDWDVTINSPQGTGMIKATFKQEGDKLTGALRSPRGETPLTGSVTGKEIKFSYPYKTPEIELTITMTGTVDGSAIKGKADFGGFAEGDWSASRAGGAVAMTAPVGAPAVSAPGTDVSGTWEFQVETGQGSGSPTFTFKQEGEKLTGQYKGAFGEAPLTGSVKGNKIEFSIKVSAQGMEGTLTYAGTIDGATMKGTVKLAELGEGTFTGKRK